MKHACGQVKDPVSVAVQLSVQTHPHEMAIHDDDPCWRTRLEVAAFAFHCMGFNSEHIGLLEKRLKDHEAECRCTRQAKAPADLQLEDRS